MRSIKQVHPAAYAPIGNLVTYTALPSARLEHIDPFLLLNHHGPQRYPPGNAGLPFGPHPHRGMETVTFVIDGDIMHKDSRGHESVIAAGGVQWMTAGRGLIHAEVSSDDFKKNGGPLEILQLWINLPADLKMTDPFYAGLTEEEIPVLTADDGKVKFEVISGNYQGVQGPFRSLSDVHLQKIHLSAGGRVSLRVPGPRNVLFYVIRGTVVVNGKTVRAFELAEVDHDGESLQIEGEAPALVLLGHALPFKEPVVARGPFVMNTNEEIDQAYEDFRHGKFGEWKQ